MKLPHGAQGPLLIIAGLAVLLAGAVFLLPADESGAQQEGLPIYTPVEMGEDLSAMWCNACHVTSVEPNEAALDAAPTFLSLAPLVREDPDRYRAFLAAPHAEAMRGLSFSNEEIEGLIAYISSLAP